MTIKQVVTAEDMERLAAGSTLERMKADRRQYWRQQEIAETETELDERTKQLLVQQMEKTTKL